MIISTHHSGITLAPMIDCGHISGTSCVSVNNQTTRSGIHCNDQTNVGHQHIDLHGREAVNKTLAGAGVSGVRSRYICQAIACPGKTYVAHHFLMHKRENPVAPGRFSIILLGCFVMLTVALAGLMPEHFI
jgi:hypothetical protein